MAEREHKQRGTGERTEGETSEVAAIPVSSDGSHRLK